MPARLQRLLDPSFCEGIEALDISEVRARRAACQEVEVSLSYARRLTQGRLDILVADMRRRAEGGNSDIQHLLDHLTPILSEGPRRDRGALPAFIAPSMDDSFVRILDGIASDTLLGDLPDLTDAELLRMGEALRDLEKELSEQRRSLHDRLDLFERELVRRYKSGEADVDSLLA